MYLFQKSVEFKKWNIVAEMKVPMLYPTDLQLDANEMFSFLSREIAQDASATSCTPANIMIHVDRKAKK